MSVPVKILRQQNRIVVSPTNADIYDLLRPVLSYTEIFKLRGKERWQAKQLGKSLIDEKYWECFFIEHKGRICTSFGFYWLIRRVLKEHGYDVKLVELPGAPHPHPDAYELNWDRVFAEAELFYRQDEFLTLLASRERGQFNCAPGFGKTTGIRLAALLFSKARIDVITRSVAILRDRIYPELCAHLPSVGIVGGGKKIYDQRIMCYTIDSLHHAKGDADIVFLDEGHELASDEASERLGIYQHARIYLLSATVNERADGKDLRLEGIAGPIIMRVGYEESLANQRANPIEVHWRDVWMDVNPADGRDDVAKKRHGIWRNDYRNELVAEDAHKYDADVQVLITCQVIEHAVRLKHLLPEFTLVYRENGMEGRIDDPRICQKFERLGLIQKGEFVTDRLRYIQAGYLPKDEPAMTRQRRMELTKAFERGELKKVIVTTVWNAGVDFKQLNVLIRADAGGSTINDTQIPGRTSRVLEGKQRSIIHDYRDQFDRGFRSIASHRKRNYEKHGWKQIIPDKSGGRMLWE